MAGLGSVALARGPGHPLMRRRYSMPEIIMRKYSLAQQKTEDSSGCESGIRAGLSSQDQSCSESDTNATPRTDECEACRMLDHTETEEHELTTAENSMDAASAVATAGNDSCPLEDQTIVSEVETTATSTIIPTTSTTSTTSATSVTSPASVTTAMQTHSTEPVTTADSAVADMAVTDNNSANALSEVTEDGSNLFLSAEYLQRIVDKQLEELYSVTPPEDKTLERSVSMTPLSDTDDTSPTTSHDIGAVATGSSYQQHLADHLCIPRYSAMPRTASMEVHPSSCNISESEGESLVDSLDDPMSPRGNTRHDSRLVRGCVMDLLPDNSTHESKADRGEAFFIPIEEPRGKMRQNVADLLPEKLRERLARRERKRIMRKEHALRKKQKRMQRNYEQQQLRDKERYMELASQKKSEEQKSKTQTKLLPSMNTKRKRATARDEILKLESYRIDGKGEMRIDTPRENRITKRSDCNRKRMSKSKKDSRPSTKEISQLRSIENRQHLQLCNSGNSGEVAGESGPRRVYQKTEIQDGEKRIEILEIVECMESSPEVIPMCMYRSHHRNSSKIPVPVYRCGSTVYSQQKCSNNQHQRSNSNKTSSSHSNSNVDKLIAEILIDALNNKTDEVHFLKSVQKSKDRKNFDSLPYLKGGSYTSSKRSTLPQIRRSANQKFLQKFEVIPEEKGSLSMESSTEEVNGNVRCNSTPAISNMPTISEPNMTDDKIDQINANERHCLENDKRELTNTEKLCEKKEIPLLTKKYQDGFTQASPDVQNPKTLAESSIDCNQNSALTTDPKVSESNVTPQTQTTAHNTIKPDNEIVRERKHLVYAETQTEDADFNPKIEDLKEEVVEPSHNKTIIETNDKYVQTVNVQSCSSQTSPNLMPNEESKSTQDQNLQPDPNLPIILNKPQEALDSTSTAQLTQKSNITLKGKKAVSNLSSGTINTNKDSSKTQFKEKSTTKFSIKKTASIKTTSIKDNVKITTDNRNSTKDPKKPILTKKATTDEPAAFSKTRRQLAAESTTEIKQETICDCSCCGGSSDDGDCARSQDTRSCSCCTRATRTSLNDCVICDTTHIKRSDQHAQTPFNETTSYHKTISVVSVPTLDNMQRKTRRTRATPTTTSPILTPSESEMSEANQYSEWLSMINGNADIDSNANDGSLGATIADSNITRTVENNQTKLPKDNFHGDKKRTTKLTRRKSVLKSPTLDAESTTKHEIRYNKNRQLQLVRPQSASPPPPAHAGCRRVQLPDPFAVNGRARGTPDSCNTSNRERRKESRHTNNPGMWSVTLAGNYCPEMPPDVEMRLRFPKHAKSDESGTETTDNGSRPCTRCRDVPTREDVRRHTAAAPSPGKDRSASPPKNRGGTSSRYEQRNSNVLPGVSKKNPNENKPSKARKIIKRIECITAVSSTPRESTTATRPRTYASDAHNIGHYFDRESCHHITTEHCGPLSRRASLCSLQPCLSVMGSAIAPEQKPRAPTMSERDLTRAQATYFSRTRSYLD